jgi:O-antigen ligase
MNRLAFYLVATLLSVLPFHAFLWTWLHSFFWDASWTIWVQAWKEILVAVLAFLAGITFLKKPRIPGGTTGWLALGLILLAGSYATFGANELSQKILGLRTATLFLVAFLAVQFFTFKPAEKSQLVRITLTAGAVVIAFALAQQFWLPTDFLLQFGYSANVSSWLPGGNLPMYHLVGETGTIRAQSTLAGPNQLGAYLLILLPLAVAAWRRYKHDYLAIFVTLGGLFVLFQTFSRAAWVGFAAMLIFLAAQQWRRNLNPQLKKRLLIGGLIGLIGLIGVGLFQPDFREILTRQASTSAHLSRSLAAAELAIENPLGLGLGSTAGVSQRFDPEKSTGLTPENTYLGYALELGWIGGALFLAFVLALVTELNQTKNPLSYSLVGLALIALFLHPLEDSTTALTLFLLAGSTLVVQKQRET